MIVIKIKAPIECLSEELDRFVKLVHEADQIELSKQELKRRVTQAKLLAFFYEELDGLVGVGAIKVPKPTHRDEVFRKAKSELESQSALYQIELGWIAVRIGFQNKGIGKTIASALLERVKGRKIYATTHDDNAGMIHLLQCTFAFHQSGGVYKCRQKKCLLFVKSEVSGKPQ
ncbi:MAG: GNAT family N-acetyltransferase [Candidatus Bathyarchaeia archaeon]